MNEKPEIEVGKLPVITKFIYTLGVLPSSYLMSMTYQEQVTWLYNYLQTQVIPLINTESAAIQELQTLYELLRTYVNDYFDNLDVQEEINKKLEEMSESGELTNLIKDYVDPIYQDYEDEINADMTNYKNSINSEVASIRNEVEIIASGSPIPVSSTSLMTDTTRLYVNTTDGYVYYYDGTDWVQGWVYQATQIADNSVSYDKLNSDLQSNFSTEFVSIGEVTEGYFLPNTNAYQLQEASGNRVRIASVSNVNKIYVTTKVLSSSIYAVTFFDSSDNRISKYDLGNITIENKEFNVPSNAVKVVVNNASSLVPPDIKIGKHEISNIDFYKLSNNVIKSLSIREYGPLTKGYVVFMSDDGASSAITNTFPIIEAKNIPWTFACWTGSDIINNSTYLTQLQTLMSNYNVKICQHWWQSYTNLSNKGLVSHLANQKQQWNTLNIDVNGLCYPSHDHNDYIMAVCGSLFNVCAGGGSFSNPLQGTKIIYPERTNGPRTNMFELYRVSVDSQTLQQLKDKIDYAYNNHLLLIIYVHDVDVTGDVKTRLEDAIDYAKNVGIEFTTINDLDKII